MKISHKWIFLSYELNDKLSAYGNSVRVEIESIRSINQGDSSNNSIIKIPSHFGTHIDYPYHFGSDSKNGSHYNADFFIFSKIGIISIDHTNIDDFIIKYSDLNFKGVQSDIDFLIIKTGFPQKRDSEEYWSSNLGLDPDIAGSLRKKFPLLRVIGFDLMSLSSYKNRELGRIAHKKFLLENNLLLVEDMDLSEIDKFTNINKLILAPLRFKNADGSPVTVFAEVRSEN